MVPVPVRQVPYTIIKCQLPFLNTVTYKKHLYMSKMPFNSNNINCIVIVSFGPGSGPLSIAGTDPGQKIDRISNPGKTK